MLTIEGLIAVISLVLTAFGLGYAIGSKDNHKTQKQPPRSDKLSGLSGLTYVGLTVYRWLLGASVISRRLFLSKEQHKAVKSSREFFCRRHRSPELIEPVRQLLILVRVKVGICVQRGLHGFMPQPFRNLQWGKAHFNQHTGVGVPLRYNNDKRKKPLFSRGLSVCRHLFNSFSKLKSDEKNIEKRRLFH